MSSFGLAASPDAPSQDACDAQLWQQSVIAVIADGVGSGENGGEAAAKVVESIVTNFKSRPRTWTIPKALEEFTKLINRTLHQESLARFERAAMLTTLAVVAGEGEKIFGLNLGDSRVYHFHGGELTQLSVDHCAEDESLRHVLTRAVGMAPDAAPHGFERTVAVGDVLLLCTDGVSNLLPPAELKSLLQHRASARTIVSAARERATEENLDDASAVVLEITETDSYYATAQPLEVPDTLHAGQLIDGFTLVRPFNTAERTWFAQRGERTVVLKFPPREARFNDTSLNQFVKEIWTVTRLKAGYFTEAFVPDSGRVLCYAMEYIEAPTLKEFLRAGPLPVEAGVTLAKFLLDACQFLLRFDLVHGDLKPENILVLKRENELTFKLIDFGSISEIFSVASRAGTPSYLAPERFRSAPISERTEIFALGVTLHQALTGTLPYGEIEPFQNPVFADPKRPGALNPNLPPWLESVILKAHSVRPEDRHQNYSEMKFELENPASVRPWQRTGAPLLERNPLLFYKVGFFVLLLVSILLLIRLLTK
ncbi:MAG: bifunctional protein-serine/threonine kinase/phosphatase [Verrucomicrobia bacterium]|nr:bifunctional protein-serine/threonine kinase/phosphatase [Verrucomicrobiota bacterium]